MNIRFRIFSLYRELFPKIKNFRGSTALLKYLEGLYLKNYGSELDQNIVSIGRTKIKFSGKSDWAPIRIEPEFVEYLIQNKGKINTFLDIGSYRGFYSILADSILEAETVFAFEMSPENFEFLEQNIELNNSSIEAINKAVWSEDTELKASTNSQGTSQIHQGEDTIATVKLDQFFSDIEDIDAMKIDVEGAELKVLEGAKNLIRGHKPIIILEYHKEKIEHFDGCKEAVFEFLKDYRIRRVNESDSDDLFIAEPL